MLNFLVAMLRVVFRYNNQDLQNHDVMRICGLVWIILVILKI